jgi:hypothetical protein
MPQIVEYFLVTTPLKDALDVAEKRVKATDEEYEKWKKVLKEFADIQAEAIQGDYFLSLFFFLFLLSSRHSFFAL